MARTLYLVGGPMGVGKTTLCRLLERRLPACAFLDGDWCWEMDPFVVNEETRRLVLDNIVYLLNSFLHCSVYENVVFGWVLFRVANLGPALQYIKRMLTPWNDTSGAMALQELMSNRCMAAVIAGVLGMGLVQAALKKFCPSVEKLKGSLAEMLWCLILAAASMLLLINGTYNPAIYLNF